VTDRTRSLLEQIAERQAALRREMARLISEYSALTEHARQLRAEEQRTVKS
jgi:hypothetical protein